MDEYKSYLYEEVYRELKEICDKKGISYEEFLNFVIEEYFENSTNNNKLKDSVVNELNILIKKIEEFSKNKKETYKVSIIPLKNIDKTLPKELLDTIDEQKVYGQFNDKFFYLLVYQKRVIGYFGLSIFNEPEPFGKYLYIYCLKLKDIYINDNLISYILNYIEGIAKREGILNVDISDNILKVGKEKLLSRGYFEFAATDIIRIDNFYYKPVGYVKEIEIINLDELNDYLPVDRSTPIWNIINNIKGDSVKALYYNNSNTKIKVYIIKLMETEDTLTKIAIFIKPLNLFDHLLLKDYIGATLKYLFENNYVEQLIIGLPPDTLGEFGALIYTSVESIGWYRKILSYINK